MRQILLSRNGSAEKRPKPVYKGVVILCGKIDMSCDVHMSVLLTHEYIVFTKLQGESTVAWDNDGQSLSMETAAIKSSGWRSKLDYINGV